MKKELDEIVYSVGPEAAEIAWIILKQVKEKDMDKLLPAIREAIDDGWKKLAEAFAKDYTQARENTRKIKEGTHPFGFEKDGMIFHKDKGFVCPDCGGVIVSGEYCGKIQALYTELLPRGIIICENNFYVKEFTEGTGECEYEPSMPLVEKPEKEPKPCGGHK